MTWLAIFIAHDVQRRDCRRATAGGLAAIAFVIAIINSANADWQYTKWGMSVEQAQRASKGSLRFPTAKEQAEKTIQSLAPALVGIHRTPQYQFNCALYFGGRGLERVNLAANDYSQKEAIIASIRAIYGEPVETNRLRKQIIYKWRDDRGNNFIQVSDIFFIRNLNIHYTPMRTGAERGL